MKFRLFLLSFIFSILFLPQLFPSVEKQGYVFYHKEVDGLAPDQSLLSEEEKAFEEMLKEDGGRFLAIGVTNNIIFDKTVFYAANYFYLGAAESLIEENVATNASAFMRAAVVAGETPSGNTVEFVEMAPQEVHLNDDATSELEINPIYNSGITNLIMQARNPVMTIFKNVPADDNKKVYLVDDPVQGLSVKFNTEAISDGNGAATSKIVGLSASYSNIFAAVNPTLVGSKFGAENSGIALLIQEDKKLKPINAQTGVNSENLAFKIDMDADVLLAINRDAQINPDAESGYGDMYWDATLQRLFVGLNALERADANQDGGVVSLLVGRMDGNNALILEPAVALNQDLFTPDSANYIFGFYYTAGAANVRSSIHKIKTMHTSTGKSYLIVNSGVGEDDVKNEVYALPLVQSATAGDGSVAANVGKVAKKGDLLSVVAAEGDMTEKTDSAALVGDGLVPIQEDQTVRDMFVVGDAVFVCVAQDRSDANYEAGIFRSSAVFGEDGVVGGWTQWQRVMGSTDKVYGAGLDLILGNYWYLTDDDTVNQNKNIVKVTQWGKSVAQPEMMGNGLVNLLNTEFPQERCGVHQVFNFDEKTISFAIDRFSMMVATGLEKVALIQTGAGVPFAPTQAQFEKDVNTFIFDDAAIKELGPICCADVSKIEDVAHQNRGWLFVAGYNGVAVLRQADGTGWDSYDGLTELSEAGFPGNGDYSFKKLLKNDGTSFSEVRKIICEGNGQFLYILTSDKLYRVAMDEDKFKDANPIALNEQEIITGNGTLLDFLVVNRVGTTTKFLLATTTGLFKSGDVLDAAVGNVIWASVNLSSGASILGPVAQLAFVSCQKGGTTVDGNLYVLGADLSLNLASIYRFDVLRGNVTAFIEPSGADYFYSIGELKANFITGGAFGYLMLSKHLGSTDFLTKMNMLSVPYNIRATEVPINLDLDSDAYYVGMMVQNTASGAWVVPGDWGIRVNE